jgi:type IV pilus assembly protein PilB
MDDLPFVGAWPRTVDAAVTRAHVRDPRLAEFLLRLGPVEALRQSGWGDPEPGLARRTGAPLPIGAAVAMVAALRLNEGGTVLVLGASPALAATICTAVASHVYVVDDDDTALAALLNDMPDTPVFARLSDPHDGWVEKAPFDAILNLRDDLSLSPELFAQLRPHARVVTLTRTSRIQQTIVAIHVESHVPGVEEVVTTVAACGVFGEVAVLTGAATREQVHDGLAASLVSGQRIGDELAAVGVVDAQERVRILALQRGLRIAGVEKLLDMLSMDVISSLPFGYLEARSSLPLRLDGGVLSVATSDPWFEPWELERVFRARDTYVYLLTDTDFRRLISLMQLGSGVSTEFASDMDDNTDEPLAAWVADNGEDTRALQILEALLLYAVGERASDIHLERYSDRVRTRLRVDGDLHDLNHLPMTAEELIAVVNIIKINAGLDIAERRRPQGGRMRRRVGLSGLDMRVQTQPSLYGEHVIIRLLTHDAARLTIESLGLLPPVSRAVRRLVDAPAGLLLVVGPTGSGKTTTLYAALQLLVRDTTRKVITAEDPIEYALPGIQQTQIRPEIGFHFADAMRSFVREDPDVILIGEIRDAETGLESMRASQTGHLVLSTLHCNDAVDAVQRLRDLGLHDNTIAAELMAVLAQRLARKICPACIEETKPEPELVAEVFPGGIPEGFRCYRGAGCERCHGRGTRGRVAVTEFLKTGHVFRTGISRQLSLDELRQIALDSGMVTMRDSALYLVQTGEIPFIELRNILLPERMVPENREAQPEGVPLIPPPPPGF